MGSCALGNSPDKKISTQALLLQLDRFISIQYRKLNYFSYVDIMQYLSISNPLSLLKRTIALFQVFKSSKALPLHICSCLMLPWWIGKKNHFILIN